MEHRRWRQAFDMKNNLQIQTTVNTGQSATSYIPKPTKNTSAGTRFSTHHCLACGDKVFVDPHPTVYP